MEDHGRERKKHAKSADPDPGSAAYDAELVGRTLAGDREAYGELVRRYMQQAFAIAYGVLRHREDAEDAVQEAFAQALDALDGFDRDRPFRPWLCRIVVNRAISLRRGRSVRIHEAIHDGLPTDDPPPDRAVEGRELRERLTQALDRLPERQRDIVVLSDVQDFNSREIAEMLGMPPGTVRYLLHLARRTLREALTATMEEEK